MRLEREEKKRMEEEERKAEEERQRIEQARLQEIVEVPSCPNLQHSSRVATESVSLTCNVFLFGCHPGNTRRDPWTEDGKHGAATAHLHTAKEATLCQYGAVQLRGPRRVLQGCTLLSALFLSITGMLLGSPFLFLGNIM